MGWREQIGFPILSVITYLPFVGALLVWLFGKGRPRFMKWTSLLTTAAVFLLSVVLLLKLNTGQHGMQFVEDFVWIKQLNVHYGFGVDGIAALLIFLTTLLTLVVRIGSWRYVAARRAGKFVSPLPEPATGREHSFAASILLLETGMIGVFCATDLFLFYVFWEVMLVPMYFIIGIWGGPRRIYAAIKFFLFTLAGSLLMLVAIIAVVLYARAHGAGLTFSIQELSDFTKVVYPFSFQVWCFIAFFVAFAIKVPMFPVHTWLPDAHVEAPTAGSVILAGVLLKMGAYGMLRFCLPMFPDASKAAVPYILVLSVVAILYGALVSMMQKDLKKLVAYSSVSHMGFVTAGIFAAIAVAENAQGMEGALLVMFSHGLLTGGLFLLVGFLYERTHTRQIADMGLLAKPLPVLAAFFMVFSLGSLGLPGLSGFPGEFLSLLGIFRYNRAMGALAAVGVVLAACYLLWMYQRILFNDRGDVEVLPADEPLSDFGFIEVAAMVPLLVFVVWAGVYPDTFLNLLHIPVRDIIDHVGPSSASSGSSTGFSSLIHLVGGGR